MTNFRWSELAFASKAPVRDLRATFIAAPRELSAARLKQLIKTYLPKGNVIIGLSTQSFVAGFEGQPQFRTLQLETIAELIKKVNAASPNSQLGSLTYAATDEPHVIAKDMFARYVFINGSWKHSFHLQPTFFALTKLKADYELVSPFVDEAEAKSYLAAIWDEVEAANPLPPNGTVLTAEAALDLAASAGRRSFDHTFQTGVVLATPVGPGKYKFITAAWNAIVPYQTAALHAGSIRERQFSPAGDLNFYDTNHAEMALLVQAATNHLELAGATLFINLLPCPTCARILSTTPIEEVVYQLDHSAGYALTAFKQAHIATRSLN